MPEMKRFRYSESERNALAECMDGIPFLIEQDENWGFLILGGHSKDDWLERKSELIANYLEGKARYCFDEFIRDPGGSPMPNEAEEFEMTTRIVKLARNLRVALSQRNSFRPNYAIEFLGRDMRPVRDEFVRWTGFSDEIILKALEEIEAEGPRVLEDFRVYHGERRWPTHGHYPIRNAFVDCLCRYWEQWTQQPMPRTRQGGPAARFVFHALDPFLKFVEREFDQKWLNKWPLDEDRNQVNEMILAYLRHSAKME